MQQRFGKKRILLAIPGELRRAAIRAALSDSGFAIVAEGSDVQTVFARGKRIEADLLVFERESSNDADYRCLRRFKETTPNAGAIMLAKSVCKNELLHLLNAGVDAIVDRRGSLRSLVSYVSLVLCGEGAVQPCLLAAAEVSPKPTIPLSAPAPAPMPQLSDRERTVVSLLANGLTDKEIARRMDLVHGTVRNYVRSVQRKLSFANRTQVAVWALQNGIVENGDAEMTGVTPRPTHVSHGSPVSLSS